MSGVIATCSNTCATPRRYGVSLMLESAIIPPGVQHHNLGKIQGFSYFLGPAYKFTLENNKSTRCILPLS